MVYARVGGFAHALKVAFVCLNPDCSAHYTNYPQPHCTFDSRTFTRQGRLLKYQS